MSRVVALVTFNAKYIHSSYALRSLQANLDPRRFAVYRFEFDLRYDAVNAIEQVLAVSPEAVVFSVYLWNRQLTLSALRLLRTLKPALPLVCGGPELIGAASDDRFVEYCDTVVDGEGEEALPRLLADLLRGRSAAPVIRPSAVDPARLNLPYELYTEEDIASRTVYAETSRGCPFSCDYCTSAVNAGVRFFDLSRVLPALDRLLERGARRIKFLDRIFNADLGRAISLLDFLLDRARSGAQFHLEVHPGRLQPEVVERLARFPAGTLHLEVGIQSFQDDTHQRLRRAQRRQDAEHTLRDLLDNTGAEVHADLIIGLPGEGEAELRDSVDSLLSFWPHEVQLSLLKRLRGTPIARHDERFGMRYNPDPPYQVLRTDRLTFRRLRELHHFCNYWDILYNRNRYHRVLKAVMRKQDSAFRALDHLRAYLYRVYGRSHALSLKSLTRVLNTYLITHVGMLAADAAALVQEDYTAATGKPALPLD